MIESLKHLPQAPGSNEALALQFTDLAPPLTQRQAAIEAARCLYCYDAPCMHACRLWRAGGVREANATTTEQV